jgi:hypothetical protein
MWEYHRWFSQQTQEHFHIAKTVSQLRQQAKLRLLVLAFNFWDWEISVMFGLFFVFHESPGSGQSGIGFCFFKRTSHFCPCCRTVWLTISHSFFTSWTFKPYLATNNLMLTEFETCMRTGDSWLKLLHIFYKTLFVWKNWFITYCSIEETVLLRLRMDAEILWLWVLTLWPWRVLISWCHLLLSIREVASSLIVITSSITTGRPLAGWLSRTLSPIISSRSG